MSVSEASASLTDSLTDSLAPLTFLESTAQRVPYFLVQIRPRGSNCRLSVGAMRAVSMLMRRRRLQVSLCLLRGERVDVARLQMLLAVKVEAEHRVRYRVTMQLMDGHIVHVSGVATRIARRDGTGRRSAMVAAAGGG